MNLKTVVLMIFISLLIEWPIVTLTPTISLKKMTALNPKPLSPEYRIVYDATFFLLPSLSSRWGAYPKISLATKQSWHSSTDGQGHKTRSPSARRHGWATAHQHSQHPTEQGKQRAATRQPLHIGKFSNLVSQLVSPCLGS